MNHHTDGNLAAIDSYLEGLGDVSLSDMTEEEREEFLWENPEAIPDNEERDCDQCGAPDGY